MTIKSLMVHIPGAHAINSKGSVMNRFCTKLMCFQTSVEVIDNCKKHYLITEQVHLLYFMFYMIDPRSLYNKTLLIYYTIVSKDLKLLLLFAGKDVAALHLE